MSWWLMHGAGSHARATRAGRNVGSMDGFVAATAEALGLTLVTRNVRDFDGLGLSLFNPWESGRPEDVMCSCFPVCRTGLVEHPRAHGIGRSPRQG